MKMQFLIFVLILTTTSVVAQHDKVVLGEFCYQEMIQGQKSMGDAMPYVYHKRIELKFQSGYQITVKNEDKQQLVEIIEKYKTSSSDKRILLGDYKPETIAGTPAVKGKYSAVIDGEKSISFFYDGKKMFIEIPELKDIFGSGTSPNHTIFIPKSCINNLLTCLKQ